MSLISLRGAEPIAGYSVTERFGAGGYGEVWKAEAPGGLQKAIKFIYGYLNEEKATRELKALNRVKQIRHPFLLSLERIEVIDGQLLIVTELADSSLKDRFQACRQENLPGIPREELLAHLRDAADALDFLSASALQHLDVKPENLLLVGGRVKVADFGLVKEIEDRTCSMMGGMTPVYAPPEVFDGRPNARSDQYSLAIVYQEMLTGILPFPGSTTAQLASQHLHSRPHVESLPLTDRAVIARALAKNPNDRFNNSRAMIDALLAAGQPGAAAADRVATEAPRPTNGDTTSASGQDTDAPAGSKNRFGSRRGPRVASTRSGSLMELAAADGPAPVVRDLEPLQIQANEVGLRPTLYLGIGGTAAKVLKRLRRRLHEQFGDRSTTPVLQMLLIDTDASSLSRQSVAPEQGGLHPDELLPMPLRRPEEYRAESGEILQWLSRRWLYNIPRSLQTEGLRPLGRLALVDHAEQLFRRIQTALERCTSEQSMAEAAKRTGLAIRDRTPRVFIIASVSGGAGSGMVLDVAYAVRMLLAEMELPDRGVCGLLTHSTSRAVEGKDLAIANAYACINELFHYSRGGYPGEPACGIPAFEQHQSPFPTTYFVHMGDRLNDHQFFRAVDELAEYLHVDAATPGGPFLDKCRAADSGENSDSMPKLRTLGVCRLGCRQGLSSQVAEYLCHHLLSGWAGRIEPTESEEGAARDLRLRRLATDLIHELELEADTLVLRFRETIEQSLKPGSQVVLEHIADELLSHSTEAAPLSARWQALAHQMAQAFGLTQGQKNVSAPARADLKQALEAQHAAQLKKIDRGLSERIAAAAEERDLRLAGAKAVADLLIEALKALDHELAARLQQLQQRLADHGQTPPDLPAASRKARKSETAPPSAWREHLVAHGRLQLAEWAALSARRLVQALLLKSQPASESLVNLRREAQRIAKQFEGAAPWARAAKETTGDNANVERAILRELQERFDGLAKHFEQTANEDLLKPCGGLIRLLNSGEQRLRFVARVAAVAGAMRGGPGAERHRCGAACPGSAHRCRRGARIAGPFHSGGLAALAFLRRRQAAAPAHAPLLNGGALAADCRPAAPREAQRTLGPRWRPGGLLRSRADPPGRRGRLSGTRRPAMCRRRTAPPHPDRYRVVRAVTCREDASGCQRPSLFAQPALDPRNQLAAAA